MSELTVSSIVLSLVEDLPADNVHHMAAQLEKETALNWQKLSSKLKAVAPKVEVHDRIRIFIERWKALPAPPTPHEMALLLHSTHFAVEHERQKQMIELLWTGPSSKEINLRRNDQALLELINTARNEIIIVSFVVYKVREILSALHSAAMRGVKITVILESPDVSEGYAAQDNIKALGPGLREHVRIFLWPEDKRPAVEAGGKVSLHVKCAVADGKRMFLSSANLTNRAMNYNMEMGILLEDVGLPARAKNVFDELIADGTLCEFSRE